MALLLQNTSLTLNDVKQSTICEMEELFEGFSECNADSGGGTNSNGTKKRLEGDEALQFLIDSGGKL